MGKARLVGLLVAGVYTLAGCSATPSTDLQAVGDPGEICTPAAGDGTALISADVLTNATDETVTITSVELVDPERLALIGGSVAEQAVGGPYQAPPEEERVMTVPPRSDATLALGLSVQAGATGSAAGAKVAFKTADGDTGSTTTVNALRVAASGTVCQAP